MPQPKTGGRPAVPRANLDAAVTRYEAGASLSVSCAGLCSVETLRKALVERGVPRRRQGLKYRSPAGRGPSRLPDAPA